MQSAPGLHRVKLYKLNETGGWDDKGTGLVSVGPMEFANHQSNSVGLVVIGEESQKMLMVHRILHEDIYNRQDETIITWTDPDIGTDVALSFQEGQGCNAIWQHVVRVQQDADPKHPDHRRRVIDEFDGPVGHLDGDYLHHDVGDMAAAGHIELPAAELSNLEELAKVLAHVPPMQRERVAQLLMSQGYLRKVLDMFRQCEDLEDTASLQHMFRLMRSMIMLNDTQLLDELLKEEHVMDVIGCLEYDPDLQQQQQHRNFLQTAVVFKEVVPIRSQEVLQKIHQTYRIQYLKDVILPRSLDDATYATLSSLMLFNNVDVVLGLYQDSNFLPELFRTLKDRKPGDPDWDDLVAFLQEFCSLAKHLQLPQRQNCWAKMTQLGMFEVITRIMQSSSAPVKLRATDILLSALAHDPQPLRSFLASQPGNELLDTLVSVFVSSEESGLPEQIAELLKLLVDPETMEGSLDKNDFMDVFYNQFMEKLIAPVSGEPFEPSASSKGKAAAAPVATPAAAPVAAPVAAGAVKNSNNSSSSRNIPASTLGLIVDLLCFCVQHHAFWAKYHVLRKNVVEKVLRLLKRKERWLVVAGVRFLRTCIGTKDDFYMRHLTKNNLLDPVMNVFLDNGERYNLLNSAVLELVDFIRRENIKSLIEYLVDKFGSRFEEVTYVDTFKQLQLKWDQSKEAAAAAAGEVAEAAAVTAGGRLYSSKRRLRRDDRELDKDEEDYFSEDSVEDEGPAAAATTAAADRAAPTAVSGGGGAVSPLGLRGGFKMSGSSSSGSSAAAGGPAAAGGVEGRLGLIGAVGGRFQPAVQQQQEQRNAGPLGLMLAPYGDDDDDDDTGRPLAKASKQQQHQNLHRVGGPGSSSNLHQQPPEKQLQQQSPGTQQQQQGAMGNGNVDSRQQQHPPSGRQEVGSQQHQQHGLRLSVGDHRNTHHHQQQQQHDSIRPAGSNPGSSHEIQSHSSAGADVTHAATAADAAGVDLSPNAAASSGTPAAAAATTPGKRGSTDGATGIASDSKGSGKRLKTVPATAGKSPQQQQQPGQAAGMDVAA